MSDSPNKESFLLEVESLMYAYPGMSYWDAYEIAVPIRRWFIKTFNKRQESANKERENLNKPLNLAEKKRIINQQKQVNPGFMQSSKK